MPRAGGTRRMSRSVKLDYTHVVNRERRANVLAFIQASTAEIKARGDYHREGTPEALTAWVDAKNILEDRKAKL